MSFVLSHRAGVGYGDFLIFSNSDISPFDELLFEHNMNYPSKSGFYDGIDVIDNEDGVKEDTDYFFKSEGNDNLSCKYVCSRYDMSLLLFRREWEKSWTPLSHTSFQRPFKQSLKELTLVAHRHGFPLDLSTAVNSFLSRDWWPDERQKCWLYDCQIESLQRILETGEIRTSKTNLICASCKVAAACSLKHLKFIHREGHKRLCRCPPLRTLSAEDMAFCIKYDQYPNSSGIIESEGDDDWDSDTSLMNDVTFVSMESSSTHMIYKYFRPFYKNRRREVHAFERYYNDEE